MEQSTASPQSETLFDNPFQIEDVMVFDDDTWRSMLNQGGFNLTLENLAYSLHHVPENLVRRITENMPAGQPAQFLELLQRPISNSEIEQARRKVLDGLFWELTYWKTPALYEELTEGERLHPGIFQQLAPDLWNSVVLDVGAGSGRASFECVRYGAKVVYAVEPSPGLLHMLEQKVAQQAKPLRIIVHSGRFDAVPLPDKSVDIALSCSAFTALPEQGGEVGLAELKRVTRAGGKIILIWPRLQDRNWLLEHGFHYVTLPIQQEMRVHFRSLQSALHCAKRFYARNRAVVRYLLCKKRPDIPFSVIGVNPPRDYCWLEVQ